ncbi:hypothetical protein KE639_00592 [Streptomyces sp. V17-9]|nr:hypothetical protein KE639_00592 [Streptomyces sp. V17-9]
MSARRRSRPAPLVDPDPVGLRLRCRRRPGGRTWHRADHTGDGGFRLDAPSGAKFVTVRASARDTVGNTVRQTVTRAFGLRSVPFPNG